MAGALQRIKRERVLVWEGAMLTRMQKPPTLEQYIGEKPRAEPAAMLNMRLRAGARGLRTISMRDYLAGRRA